MRENAWIAAVVAEVKERSERANRYKPSRSVSAWVVMALTLDILVLILVAL